MKKICSIIMVMVLVLTSFTGCGKKNEGDNKLVKQQNEADTSSDKSTTTKKLLSGKHHISIEIQDYGTIKAELDADQAPISVTNFVNLAKQGFYDGLTFHRIIDGFMIQGGDPNGDGTGGAKETIKGEFTQNGVQNNISHTRGTLSMARAQDMNSASSQFFIMQADVTNLDGQYAAFGRVSEGIEIVDEICKKTPVTDDNGTVLKKNQPVITTIKVID